MNNEPKTSQYNEEESLRDSEIVELTEDSYVTIYDDDENYDEEDDRRDDYSHDLDY